MKNGISFSLSLADSTNAKYESVLSSTLMDFPHIERDTECYLSKIHDLFSTGSDLIVTTFPSAVAVNLTSPAVLMYGLLPV